MKKELIPCLLLTAITAYSQQWSGNSNATDPISRTGNATTSGLLSLDGYNSAQVRLNNGGTYYPLPVSSS